MPRRTLDLRLVHEDLDVLLDQAVFLAEDLAIALRRVEPTSSSSAEKGTNAPLHDAAPSSHVGDLATRRNGAAHSRPQRATPHHKAT